MVPFRTDQPLPPGVLMLLLHQIPKTFYKVNPGISQEITLNVQKFFLTSVFYCLDTYHDFLHGGRLSFPPDPTIFINFIQDAFKRDIYINEMTKHPELLNLINVLYSIIAHPALASNPETAMGHLMGFGDPDYLKTPITPGNAFQVLESIFGIFGCDIKNDATPIKIVVDGGLQGLGVIDSNLEDDAAIGIDITYIVTPASICDSAGLQLRPFLRKPFLFETPNQGDLITSNSIDAEGNPIASPIPTLFSDAAFFSGSNIAVQSSIFDINSTPRSRYGVIHVNNPNNGGNRQIHIKDKSGPSLNELWKSIYLYKKGKIYDGKPPELKLSRFNSAEKYDIKRCADSDQAKMCKLLQIEAGNSEKYFFVSGDRLSAMIACYIYKLPSIFQSSAGTQNGEKMKKFTFFFPDGVRPRENEEFYNKIDKQISSLQSKEITVGGNTPSHLVKNPMYGGFPPTDIDVPSENDEGFHTSFYEPDYFLLMCELAKDQILSYIEDIERIRETQSYKVASAACSVRNIINNGIHLEIQPQFIHVHDILYQPPINFPYIADGSIPLSDVDIDNAVSKAETWLDQYHAALDHKALEKRLQPLPRIDKNFLFENMPIAGDVYYKNFLIALSETEIYLKPRETEEPEEQSIIRPTFLNNMKLIKRLTDMIENINKEGKLTEAYGFLLTLATIGEIFKFRNDVFLSPFISMIYHGVKFPKLTKLPKLNCINGYSHVDQSTINQILSIFVALKTFIINPAYTTKIGAEVFTNLIGGNLKKTVKNKKKRKNKTYRKNKRLTKKKT